MCASSGKRFRVKVPEEEVRDPHGRRQSVTGDGPLDSKYTSEVGSKTKGYLGLRGEVRGSRSPRSPEEVTHRDTSK